MTKEEYKRIRAEIDQKYREDVAALERVFAITSGVAPAPMLEEVDPAAAAIPLTAEDDVPVNASATRRSKTPLTPEQKKERARAYARAYYKKSHSKQ